MADLGALFDKLLASKGGDYGEAFNDTEAARAGQPSSISGLSPEELVQLNRMAQSADSPITALLAGPYEAMKGVEQSTSGMLPLLSGPGQAMNSVGIPVALPNKANTSPASLGNVTASFQGAGKRASALLQGLLGGR